MSHLPRVLVLASSLMLVACGAGPPKTRMEAYEWLRDNWESAQPHARRLVDLCAEQEEETATAGMGTSSLPPDVEEVFGKELRAARAILVTCRFDFVRLDFGGGAEGRMDFYAAYFYIPAAVVEDPPCSAAAFDLPKIVACMTRMTDDWYIGIHWFPPET